MNIEEYVSEFSQPEHPILKELGRETKLKVLMPRMLSGQIQGKLLQFLVYMLKPSNILELGTYTGYSAISMAMALPENAVLHSIEINDELESFIRKYINKAGLEHKIILHIGNALNIVPKMEQKFDFIFIDADKRLYPQYYDLVFPKLKVGGFMLADNVLWGEKVIQTLKQNDEYTKGILQFNQKVLSDNRTENFILPVRDGISIIRKIAD